MEVEEAELEGDMPMCDHVYEQNNLKRPQAGRSPLFINAINILGRTSDGDVVDVVCDSVSYQLGAKE